MIQPILHVEVAGRVDRADAQHVVVRHVSTAGGGVVQLILHVEVIGRVDRDAVTSRVTRQHIEQEIEVAARGSVGAAGRAGQPIPRGERAGAPRPVARQAGVASVGHRIAPGRQEGDFQAIGGERAGQRPGIGVAAQRPEAGHRRGRIARLAGAGQHQRAFRDVDLLAERGFDHVDVQPGEILALVGAGLQGPAQGGRARIAQRVGRQVTVEAGRAGRPGRSLDVQGRDRGRGIHVDRLGGRAGGARRGTQSSTCTVIERVAVLVLLELNVTLCKAV